MPRQISQSIKRAKRSDLWTEYKLWSEARLLFSAPVKRHEQGRWRSGDGDWKAQVLQNSVGRRQGSIKSFTFESNWSIFNLFMELVQDLPLNRRIAKAATARPTALRAVIPSAEGSVNRIGVFPERAPVFWTMPPTSMTRGSEGFVRDWRLHPDDYVAGFWHQLAHVQWKKTRTWASEVLPAVTMPTPRSSDWPLSAVSRV